MELIADQLSDADKINVNIKHLKSTTAEWFSMIQDKVDMYQELVQAKILE